MIGTKLKRVNFSMDSWNKRHDATRQFMQLLQIYSRLSLPLEFTLHCLLVLQKIVASAISTCLPQRRTISIYFAPVFSSLDFISDWKFQFVRSSCIYGISSFVTSNRFSVRSRYSIQFQSLQNSDYSFLFERFQRIRSIVWIRE